MNVNCFEPELKKDTFGKFNCFPYGVAERYGKFAFRSGDRDSSILEGDINDIGGESIATAQALDEALSGERVTFIKMDIEGAELSALRGAKKIIQQQKPILAVCIYHGVGDMLNVPTYIKKLVPEYQIYIRHYTNEMFETVCYAIPPERLK